MIKDVIPRPEDQPEEAARRRDRAGPEHGAIGNKGVGVCHSRPVDVVTVVEVLCTWYIGICVEVSSQGHK